MELWAEQGKALLVCRSPDFLLSMSQKRGKVMANLGECSPCMPAWNLSPVLCKPGMVVLTFSSSTPEVEGQGSAVQGHLQSHSTFIVILGDRRSCLSKIKQDRFKKKIKHRKVLHCLDNVPSSPKACGLYINVSPCVPFASIILTGPFLGRLSVFSNLY